MPEVLAQQEMFEAPPPRSAIVHDGCTAWWGVDPSTRGVSIGTVTPDGHRAVRTTLIPKAPGARRLSITYAQTRDLAQALAASYPPGLILVEQPSGSVINHELEYAVGIIQAAIYDGVYTELGHGPRMDTVASSWWKVRACGRGDIYKTAKVNGRKKLLPLEEYGVMRWARLNGYQGASWDEADALAIAEAARRDVALQAR